MKDGSRTEEPAEVSRHELYEDYLNCYRQLCPEVRPCRDDWLLKKAAQYLLREPEPAGTFTVFPFYQAVSRDCYSPNTDCRKHLSAFIKATELLETLCVNLFVQPWRKEIKTLKAFTGPFVYCLLPVLSSATIQSLLASIGYLPTTDSPQSEYRLSEDANPDRAMLLGFELLLARVECNHFLELLEKDQLGPQEWLEVLQRRVGPTKPEEATDKKTIIGQKEEEEKKKKEEADEKEVGQSAEGWLTVLRRRSERKELTAKQWDQREVSLHLDTGSENVVKPQPKPRPCHLFSRDHSIMEMQMTYPDLAFRGRPLLPDKPQRANSSRSSKKDVHTSSTNNYSDDSKAAELSKRDCSKGAKAAATTIHSKNDGSKAGEVFGDDGKDSGCDDRNSGGATPPVDSSISNIDGSRVDDELSGPQAISLHITLRAGSKAEQSLKPGEPQPTAEPPAWTQQQTVADLQNKRPANPKLPSLSSMDEVQELRELAERMGQVHVQDTKEEVKRTEENKRREENTNKERRKKERKASTEGEAQEQNLRKPVMETGPALSCAASRCTRPSQSDPAVMKEQKQPTVCHHSPLTISTADYQSCEGGGSAGQQEGAETGGGEEEQLAQSFVIVEHHKK